MQHQARIILICVLIKTAMNLQCLKVKAPQERIFNNLHEYRRNTLPFDASQTDFNGNYVLIKNVHGNLSQQDFVSYTSNYVIRLTLADNKIENINSGTFNGLGCLEELQLQHNEIKSIGVTTFLIVDHLIYLNLSYNQLGSLDQRVFSKLNRLRRLDLSHNQLKHIDFINLSGLVYLNVSFNALDVLNMSGFDNLQELDASNNHLTHLNVKQNFNYLHNLLLGGNNLAQLNADDFNKFLPQLVTLEIHNNSWMCEDLATFTAGLKRIKINSTNIHCKNVTTTTTTTEVNLILPHLNQTHLEIKRLAMLIDSMDVSEAISDVRQIIIVLLTLIVLAIVVEFIIRAGVVSRAREWRCCKRISNQNDDFDLMPYSNVAGPTA